MVGRKGVPDNRPRHPDKDIEDLIRLAEARGWRIMKGRKYYKAYCPCDDEHIKTIHLSPSGTMYLVNLRKWFNRQTCWEVRDDG